MRLLWMGRAQDNSEVYQFSCSTVSDSLCQAKFPGRPAPSTAAPQGRQPPSVDRRGWPSPLQLEHRGFREGSLQPQAQWSLLGTEQGLVCTPSTPHSPRRR